MQHMTIKSLCLATALLFSVSAAVAATTTSGDSAIKLARTGIIVAQGGSCGAWKSTCESRGGGASCGSKYRSCLKSGCFTEGEKFGGATHCNLAKQ